MKILPSFRSCLHSLILVAGATTLACGAAAARDPQAPMQRTVSFADLNLDHADGVKALHGRLTAAAQAVCPQVTGAPYLQRAQSRQCADSALANAVAEIGNANLSAYFVSRNGSTTTAQRMASRR